MSIQIEALIGMSDYSARETREKYYTSKALGALTKDIGIADISKQEDFDKFKAAFPAVIIGTGWNHFKFKRTLLAELGRWYPQHENWIAQYARRAEGKPVKEFVALLRENRLKWKREEKELVSGTNIKEGDEDGR
jgi:hypothetical protein